MSALLYETNQNANFLYKILLFFVSIFIDVVGTHSLRDSMMNQMLHLDINSQIRSCMPLAAMRIGTMIHNIEVTRVKVAS